MDTLTKHSTANNSALKIIVTVLFVALPFVGFYWGMQYQSLMTPVSEPPTPLVRKPTPTPKQEVDETANWKKYTSPQEDNALLKVTIKYPDFWELNQTRYGQPFAPGYGFTIEDSTKNSIIDLITFAPVIYKTTSEYLTRSKDNLIDSQEVNFQGIKAIKGLYPWSKEAEQIVETFFVKDSNGYIILERYTKEYENISSLPIPNPNIVSTFMFLDQ